MALQKLYILTYQPQIWSYNHPPGQHQEVDALLEASHAIRREGALSCNDCHSKNGVMDYHALGYDQEEIETLTEPRY